MNDRFAPTCLSIDLEVAKKDGRIHEFAAVRGDTGAVFHCTGSEPASRLEQLTAFAESASFLLCHNIVAFDLPILRAHFPSLPLLNLAVVDTLRLNPLCFPHNPYHHLVKHYQSGQLHCQQKNDPVQDAKLAMPEWVFSDNRLQPVRASYWAAVAPTFLFHPSDAFSSFRKHKHPTDTP